MFWHHLFLTWREWRRRIRTRRDIARLDEQTAHDLGLSASQLRFESQKPFWRS